MGKKMCLIFAIGLLMGCAISQSSFIRSGDYVTPPKAPDSDILIFFEGDPPQRKYKVLGMVYAEQHALNNITLIKPGKIIQLLKKEAIKAGADAIIDVHLGYAPGGVLDGNDRKLGQAQAVIFIKTDN